jgi:hypothetical protein
VQLAISSTVSSSSSVTTRTVGASQLLDRGVLVGVLTNDDVGDLRLGRGQIGASVSSS